MKGYFEDKEETDKVLMKHKDGKVWLHTSDYGYMDKEGRIYHCGRAKRMITRSGDKVWLTAIEEIIKTHHNVFDCCVVKKKILLKEKYQYVILSLIMKMKKKLLLMN